jgi:MtN3 and saliva related transmembrane protein
MSGVDVLGWCAALSVIGISIPQLVLLLRTRDTSGIAVTTWVINLGTYIGWLSHGIVLNQWPMIAPNILGLGATLAILYALMRQRKLSFVRLYAPGLTLGALMIVLDLFIASSAFGIAAMIPGCISMGRQGVELLRSPDVTGVSTASWFWQVATQALWFVWAILVHDPGTTISTIVSVIVAAIVLAIRVFRGRGWHPRTVVAQDTLG